MSETKAAELPRVIATNPFVGICHMQVCAVAVLIAGSSRPYLQPAAQILLWLVVASALISAAQYFYRFWSQLDDRIKQRRKLRMLEARAKSEDVVPS